MIVDKKTVKQLTKNNNRGMELESSINNSNNFYNENNIAYISKRPTPIHVISSKDGIINRANYEKDSTLDYNGIYKQRYIEFEAKSTKSETSFPLGNIKKHQLEHLKRINELGGITFLIIEFSTLNKYFLLTYEKFSKFLGENSRKSLPIEYFLENCPEIKQGFNPRLYYLEALDSLTK